MKYPLGRVKNPFEKSKSLRTIPAECFCVDQKGNELPGTRTSPLTADQLDCTHAGWYTEYLIWRKSQFGAWFQTFNAFLAKKEFDITKLPRGKDPTNGFLDKGIYSS